MGSSPILGFFDPVEKEFSKNGFTIFNSNEELKNTGLGNKPKKGSSDLLALEF